MIKTVQVAADRAYDQAKTVLPAEVARGVYIKNPPGAEALKLMHLLIGTAGGRMAEDVRHELRLADIKKVAGMRNHSRSTLRELFIELSGAVIAFDNTETQCEIIGGFLDRAKLDYRHQASDDLLVSWWFGGAFREMAEQSCHWAILDRQTVFNLSSKYSILLFQHIASLVNLNHVAAKTFSVAELRALLGIPEGKIERFANLNKDVIQPTIAEINQISRLNLAASPNKVGRTVASVTIGWTEKQISEKKEVKREIDRSKVGRKVRREEGVEVPSPAQRVSFPQSGGLKYEPVWYQIAEKHAQRIQGGHLPDTNGLASAFRDWCGSKGISLDAKNIEAVFVGFCKNYRPLI